jgi:branched-chain amino acid transport system permease protein
MVKTFLRSIYTSFVTDIIDVPPRLLSFMLFLLLMFLPLAQLGVSILYLLTLACIWAIFAASWDLLVGRTGQMSLGHSLFFGIGAYATALLYRFYGWPPWVTIPLAMLLGVLAALLVGFPCLRVKGPYLALVTMAFPLIAQSIVLVYVLDPITGGASGVYVRGLFHFLDAYQQGLAEYYLALLLLLVSGIILYKVANSRVGIVLVSILDDDLASKACGINVTKYKLLAFAISALFATLAGCLFAHVVGVAGPATFQLTFSFLAVTLTILGGLGTIYGPIAAAFIIQTLDRYVLAIPKLTILGAKILPLPFEWHDLIFMVVVVIFVIKWPRGLSRFVTDKLEDLSEEREIEERGPHIWKKYKRKKESTHED